MHFTRNPNYKQQKKKRKLLSGIKNAAVKITAFVIVALIVIGILIGLSQLLAGSVDLSQTETYIFQYINEERTNRNLPVLSNDTSLTIIACEWSDHLSEINELTHGNFEGRIASIGYSYYSCGEIIASFQSGTINGIPTTNSPSEIAREFVDMWLNSPPHREIMLTASSGYMGVGLSRNSAMFYGVVDFRFS